MKYLVLTLITILTISCEIPINERAIIVDNEVQLIKNNSSFTKMTFFDNDSLYNTSFKAVSEFDGEKLTWTINIYENDTLSEVIKDSLKSMSYLVKAIDINNNKKGELVFVTGDFYNAFDDVSTIKCEIYLYTKIMNLWTRMIFPELTENQKIGYYGSEVVTVEDNMVLRKFPIHDNKKKETGKSRLIKYSMNHKNEIFIHNEQIIIDK